MTKKLVAIIQKDGKQYLAQCPSVGVATQGKTVEKALANLKEAVELYLEVIPRAERRDLPAGAPIITTLEVAG